MEKFSAGIKDKPKAGAKGKNATTGLLHEGQKPRFTAGGKRCLANRIVGLIGLITWLDLTATISANGLR
uniref:hypothetical protein n=1 Tax=unclassified Colwellia TaxID=196834 RepID=UPI0021750089|nr:MULTISPECIES: hypothetical protein [unclassified Colwellia]